MADPPDRRRLGTFGTSFLVVLVVGTLLFMGLLWTRGCGADDDPLDAPEQTEVDEVTSLPAVRPAVA